MASLSLAAVLQVVWLALPEARLFEERWRPINALCGLLAFFERQYDTLLALLLRHDAPIDMALLALLVLTGVQACWWRARNTLALPGVPGPDTLVVVLPSPSQSAVADG